MPDSISVITWSTSKQIAHQAVKYKIYYRTNIPIGCNIWMMDTLSPNDTNYTTVVVVGTTPAGNYFYINPFNTKTSPDTTGLPSYSRRIYARLWKSPNPDMSGAVPMSDWRYYSVSSPDSVGAVRDGYFTLSMDTSLIPNNEYVYIEFAWTVTSPAVDTSAGFYFR